MESLWIRWQINFLSASNDLSDSFRKTSDSSCYVIIAREFIISGFRLVASDNGVVIAANYWGKFKTVSQMAMIIVLIADFGGVFDMVGTVLIWIATALTVISLVDYVWANREVLTKGGM